MQHILSELPLSASPHSAVSFDKEQDVLREHGLLEETEDPLLGGNGVEEMFFVLCCFVLMWKGFEEVEC